MEVEVMVNREKDLKKAVAVLVAAFLIGLFDVLHSVISPTMDVVR